MAIFGAGVARSYVTRYRQRLEESAQLRTELAEARLAMLRSQLNPHFLYNTLNAISALVEIDPPGVRRMIARLSELLRIALEPSESAEVPLSKELGITERYLDILRIRFEGRLDASVDASPELYDALVPPMILQPLVENAMKHAVGKSAARSQIRIAAERSGEALVLRVRDSGPGSLNGASVGATDEQSNDGVGLRNTRARLREIYGTDCSLALERTDSGGMEATIRLPFHTMADLRATPAGNPNDR
jgi:LytS/YehU family sensor histidine kinase